MTHDDVWHVLPFYVNGTLRGPARADVDAHLATCTECRAELVTQTQVRDTILHEEVRQESAQTSFDQLWDRIQEDEAVSGAHHANARDAAPALHRVPASRAMKWLVAAVIVEGIGLATLSAMTWSQGASTAPDYRTLSDPSQPSGGQIRAVFAPDLKLAELQSLLSGSKLSVVGGPTEAGVYTLALEEANASVDNALTRLRGSASVRFAEPIARARVVEK
jgi:anti-sigma factor RsiW